MIKEVLSHFSIITLALALMGFMLEVKIKKNMDLKQKIGIAIIISIYLMAILLEISMGDEFYRKSYPFTVQLPSFIAFALLCSYALKKVFFAFVTAITMIGLPLTILKNLSRIMELNVVINIGIIVFVGLICIYAIKRWVAEDIHFVFEQNEKMWLLPTIIPCIYWIVTYIKDQYKMERLFSEQMSYMDDVLWVIVLLSYFLVFSLFHMMHDLHDKEQIMREFAVQQEAVQQGIKQMYFANEQSRIYRHDMRHHFTALFGYLNENKGDQAKRYIKQIMEGITDITPSYYCDCEMLNMVLSSFVTLAQKKGITLEIKAFVGEFVPMEDKELCVLISNALENAIHAVEKIKEIDNKNIYVDIQNADGKLLIEITNPYIGEIELKKGIPIRSHNGNGLGIASIVSVVEKYYGLYSFDINANKFTLKIVI